MSGDSVLRFQEFELDVASGELHRRGRKVKLAPQPFRLLALLANSPGEVLTREALRKQLWRGTFVDFEHSLNFCVREVRKALGDRAARARFIETLPRRGYRFTAPVSRPGQNGNPSEYGAALPREISHSSPERRNYSCLLTSLSGSTPAMACDW